MRNHVNARHIVGFWSYGDLAYFRGRLGLGPALEQNLIDGTQPTNPTAVADTTASLPWGMSVRPHIKAADR